VTSDAEADRTQQHLDRGDPPEKRRDFENTIASATAWTSIASVQPLTRASQSLDIAVDNFESGFLLIVQFVNLIDKCEFLL
jgi:hypothetical protein